MLKVKQNDMFKKNMSRGELYQVYKTFKAKKEMDKFLNKIIVKNGTTKYQYGKEIRKQMGRNNSGYNNHSNNDSKMRDFKITKKDGEWYNTIVTDSYGKVYQNWYETASEASDWVMYIWEKEDWFNSVNSEELLYNAIQECKAIDKDKGIGSIL